MHGGGTGRRIGKCCKEEEEEALESSYKSRGALKNLPVEYNGKRGRSAGFAKAEDSLFLLKPKAGTYMRL